jgi:hypothetical protein
MIQRAFIHVAGPAGCGKTTFVEALLATGRWSLDAALRTTVWDASRSRRRDVIPN